MESQTEMLHLFLLNENWSIMNFVTSVVVYLYIIIMRMVMIINGKQAVIQINYQANLQEINRINTEF